MERLWAPWRMKYIEAVKANEASDGGCVLCRKGREADDAGNLVVLRGATCFLMMNLFPYTNGHLMAVPFRHTADLAELSDAERLELFELARKGTAALGRAMRPDGFNLGMNLGKTAGAGIEDHLHLHIVPRWNGDTNFMSVLGETRVISEGLRETYERLKSATDK